MIVDRHYIADPQQVTLMKGVVEGLRELRSLSAIIVAITNQSGVARGLMSVEQVSAVNAEVDRQLLCNGLNLDGWYVCPHGPRDGCRCRKPAPGLVERACRDLGLSARGCFVIGDKGTDVEVAAAVGGTGILLTAHPEKRAYGAVTVPHFAAAARLVAERWRGNER